MFHFRYVILRLLCKQTGSESEYTHTHTEYTHFRKGSQILLSAECNKSKYIYMSAACCGHIFILTSCSAEGLNYCSHCHTIQVVHVY